MTLRQNSPHREHASGDEHASPAAMTICSLMAHQQPGADNPMVHVSEHPGPDHCARSRGSTPAGRVSGPTARPHSHDTARGGSESPRLGLGLYPVESNSRYTTVAGTANSVSVHGHNATGFAANGLGHEAVGGVQMTAQAYAQLGPTLTHADLWAGSTPWGGISGQTVRPNSRGLNHSQSESDLPRRTDISLSPIQANNGFPMTSVPGTFPGESDSCSPNVRGRMRGTKRVDWRRGLKLRRADARDAVEVNALPPLKGAPDLPSIFISNPSLVSPQAG